jgi:hypothetical protein
VLETLHRALVLAHDLEFPLVLLLLDGLSLLLFVLHEVFVHLRTDHLSLLEVLDDLKAHRWDTS